MTPDNVTGWIAANVAFLGVEVARHGELVDWYLTATGSVTLILYNVMKSTRFSDIHRAKVKNPKKRGRDKAKQRHNLRAQTNTK